MKKNDKFKVKFTRAMSGALVAFTLLTSASGCAREFESREMTAQEIEYAQKHDDEFGILVNKENAVTSEYMENVNLVKTQNFKGEEVYIQKDALEAFNALKAKLAEQGHEIDINSGYRSLEEQEATYNELLAEYGKEYADNIVAPVGHSEHHTGLAIDVYIGRAFILGKQIPLKVNLEYKANRNAMYEIMADYGFILRYPEGKEEITGYPEEEWHIRYVGTELAKLLADKNLTLEEYYELINEYNSGAVDELEDEMQ